MFKKLDNDNKLLENKLEKIRKEASKPLGIKIQVVEKGTKLDPIHFTSQEDANWIEEQTYKDVGVQTIRTPYRNPNHKNKYIK